MKMPTQIPAATSPFGQSASLVETFHTEAIRHAYFRKCGVDIGPFLGGEQYAYLYRCDATGFEFWQPAKLAGPEELYRQLNAQWPNYYRTSRWEYPLAAKAISRQSRVLEIGCGRGYFLQSLERTGVEAIGVELNAEAIEKKVTDFPVLKATIRSLGELGDPGFDAVCAFQVLEHLVDPAEFLKDAMALLRPNGLLILSTPNTDCMANAHRSDPFDLPPHHMGRFNEQIYRNIADKLGLEVVQIHLEPRTHDAESATGKTTRSFAYRMVRLAARGLYRLGFWLGHEPGPNILVVLKKPA